LEFIKKYKIEALISAFATIIAAINIAAIITAIWSKSDFIIIVNNNPTISPIDNFQFDIQSPFMHYFWIILAMAFFLQIIIWIYIYQEQKK